MAMQKAKIALSGKNSSNRPSTATLYTDFPRAFIFAPITVTLQFDSGWLVRPIAGNDHQGFPKIFFPSGQIKGHG
jgi:hypothetical protein